MPNKLVSFFSFPNKLSFFSAGFKKLKVGGSGALNSTGSARGLREFSIFGSLLDLGFEFAAVSNLESETSSSVPKVTTFCLVAYALIIEISLSNKMSSSPSGSQLSITRLELFKTFELLDFPRINEGPAARFVFKGWGKLWFKTASLSWL